MFFFSKDPYKKLKRAIGSHKVLDREEDRMVYAVDATYTTPAGNHDPDVVVLAESSEDVIESILFARKNDIPVIPRGAGTGMSGGAIPMKGGMVIVTEKMKRVIEINVHEQWIQCEPGLTTQAVKRAVSAKRLFYPPDPSSYKISSIGGNIAENAGGLRCVKYGTTADYVLGLKYVNAEGELICTGALADSSQSLDLTSTLVGSEGLLGMIVEARLALIPEPKHTRTMIAHFDATGKAIKTIHTLLPELVPSVMEFMDTYVIQAISQFDPYPFPDGTQAALLIETDGNREQADREAKRVIQVLEDIGALEIHTADAEKDRERLWELRRLISPSLSRLASGKMNEDVVVPLGRIAHLIQRVREISNKYDIVIPIYGHAGDGNLHLNAMYDRSVPSNKVAAYDAIQECFQATIELGGTISGEHGIGAAKTSYMSLQFSEDEMVVLKALKKAFDPDDFFNPSKMFPSTSKF